MVELQFTEATPTKRFQSRRKVVTSNQKH